MSWDNLNISASSNNAVVRIKANALAVKGKTATVKYKKLKKKVKKGTYKVTVKVRAAGDANYNASAWKNLTFKVKVK